MAADGGTVKRELSRAEGRRPALSDDEVLRIAELGVAIEREYGAPQDTEWAYDPDGDLWMLQSRPITTLGEVGAQARGDMTAAVETTSPAAEPGVVLLRGLGAAPGQSNGAVRLLRSLDQADRLSAGDVLVTHMTSPDWVPLMRKAAAIITDSGGMTCHAAIVSRELGIPCVVGTGDATKHLRDGELVTVDATHGTVLEGSSPPGPTVRVPAAALAPASANGRVMAAPQTVTVTRLLVNLSEPSQVDRAAQLDVDGGLVRAELMLVEALNGTHPRKLLARAAARSSLSDCQPDS